MHTKITTVQTDNQRKKMLSIFFSLFIPIFFVFMLSGSLQAQKTKLFAASCHKDGGRCSGDAYCTACKNCSGCKKCNSGGTCGVCTSYATEKTVSKTPAPKTTNHSKSSFTSTTVKSPKAGNPVKKTSGKTSPRLYAAGDVLHVLSQKLSLRDGPGTDYPIIEQLKKDDTVQLLGYEGEWIQVIVMESKNIGYIKLVFVQ